MAKIKKGAIIAGEMSGMIGDELVFRQRAGQVVVGAPPNFGENRQWTEAQRGRQDAFRAAALYGQRVVVDAETKAEYQRRAQDTPKSAFNPDGSGSSTSLCPTTCTPRRSKSWTSPATKATLAMSSRCAPATTSR